MSHGHHGGGGGGFGGGHHSFHHQSAPHHASHHHGAPHHASHTQSAPRPIARQQGVSSVGWGWGRRSHQHHHRNEAFQHHHHFRWHFIFWPSYYSYGPRYHQRRFGCLSLGIALIMVLVIFSIQIWWLFVPVLALLFLGLLLIRRE